MIGDRNGNFLINLPARFDWSIMGCTILRRALINLKQKQTFYYCQKQVTKNLLNGKQKGAKLKRKAYSELENIQLRNK